MLDGLGAVRDQAYADGHQGLFVAGKMTWTLAAGFDPPSCWPTSRP